MNLFGQTVGLDGPLLLLAGPCVIESEALAIETAGFLKAIADKLGINFVYKSSFDKANRSSHESFRGLGLDTGLKILDNVKQQIGVPIVTDVHEDTPLDEVAAVVDIIQTPAFLCRQTNFLERVAKTNKPLNVKKGQFLAPEDMLQVVKKVKAFGNDNVMVCERGVSFGYHNLVSDMRSLVTMRETGCPVIYDATHSVQQPGGLGTSSGGRREFVPPLARAAMAVGIAGIFMETHPNPDKALSDGPNAVPLDDMPALLETLLAIRGVLNHADL